LNDQNNQTIYEKNTSDGRRRDDIAGGRNKIDFGVRFRMEICAA